MRPLSVFLLFVFVGCTPQQPVKIYSSEVMLIEQVNIIDIKTGELKQNQYIIIDEGKIQAIQSEKPDIPESATAIKGKNKFLIPGLAEMHAHIPSPDWGRDNMEETLFLYLSNGVTTIRGMLGHPVHLELRQKAAANEILSPRIITSSPSLNGFTVRNKEEAINRVKAYKEAGYDFLKLHPGIKLDVFNELVKTANEVDIDFAGHVSIDVGVRNALISGYASIDHVDGFIEGLVSPEKELDPNANGFFGYNFTYDADTTQIDELVALSKKHKVWVVPTQTLFERWFSPDAPELLAAKDEMAYMPKETVENWVKSKKNLIDSPDFNEAKWNAFNRIRRSLIYKLHKSGQGLLLGSDAPQVFNVPGFSIHHELQSMLKAGLSPLEALQIGTLNPAKFLEREGEFGEITIGASADFILLNTNPINDLEAMKDMAGVMVRGKWLSKEMIDEKLAEIAKRMNQ